MAQSSLSLASADFQAALQAATQHLLQPSSVPESQGVIPDDSVLQSVIDELQGPQKEVRPASGPAHSGEQYESKGLASLLLETLGTQVSQNTQAPPYAAQMGVPHGMLARCIS